MKSVLIGLLSIGVLAAVAVAVRHRQSGQYKDAPAVLTAKESPPARVADSTDTQPPPAAPDITPTVGPRTTSVVGNQVSSATSAKNSRVRHLPSSLAEMPHTAQFEQAMQTITTQDPSHTEPAMTDYAVATISALNDCVGDRISTGWAGVQLGFVRSSDSDRVATGTSVELIKSNLSDDDKNLVVQCLDHYHRERGLDLPAGSTASGEMVSHLNIVFPIADSNIYKFLATGHR